LNREIFYSLKEAQIVIERWRVLYNTLRSHSSLPSQSQGIAAAKTCPSSHHRS